MTALRRKGAGGALGLSSGVAAGLFTGLMDAGNPALARLYRRAGFLVSPAFPFRGGSASTIELRTLPAARRKAC